MDHYRASQQDEESIGAIPVSLGSYHNQPPPPNPNPINIRVSAFSKPNSSSSSSQLNNILISSPKDHHHHHHHGSSSSAARNNNNRSSTTADQFMSPTTTTVATDNPPPPPPQDHTAAPIPVIGICPSSAATAAGSVLNSKAVTYRECLRNHAASVGGHVLDGCCEFMPSNTDPLRCAACDCHRSFHRKHPPEGTSSNHHSSSRRDRISVPLLLPPPPHPSTLHHYHSHPSQKQQLQFASSVAFPPSPSGVDVPGSSSMVAFGGNNSGSGATTESSSEEMLDAGVCAAPMQQHSMVLMSKKRYRTKFSPEQKEKMLSFAERVGWRIQRQDDAAIDSFCREIGVRRQVLKVWMHNNKHSMLRKQQQIHPQQPQIHQQAAGSPSTPTSLLPGSAIFGHVRN